MTGPTEFTLSYPITVEASLNAARLAAGRRRRWLSIAAWLVIVVVGLGLIGQADPWLGFLVTLLGLSGVASIVLPGFKRGRIRRTLRGFIGESVTMTFTERGISVESSYESAEIPWRGVTEIREDRNIVLFMRERLPLALFPTSACPPMERADIVALARRQIEASADSSGPVLRGDSSTRR